MTNVLNFFLTAIVHVLYDHIWAIYDDMVVCSTRLRAEGPGGEAPGKQGGLGGR